MLNWSSSNMNSVVAILCVCDACAFVIYMNAYLRVNDMHFNSCLYFSSYFYLYIFFRCVTSNQKQHKKNAKYKNQHRSNTTTISDSEFNSHEDDDEETQATNINEMFDYALALLWPLVTKNKWDMTSLPDITEGFSYVSCIPSFRHSVIFCCIFFCVFHFAFIFVVVCGCCCYCCRAIESNCNAFGYIARH